MKNGRGECQNRNYSSVVVICRKKYNIVEDLKGESVVCIRGKVRDYGWMGFICVTAASCFSGRM